ncbi:MAG: SDR family oxidoreductase [Stellaceae bacterium]
MKSDRTTLSIGELARLAECQVDTIRYYERIGIMPKPERSEGKQRRYNEQQARQLLFIRRLRDLGFSVEEASGFLAMRRQDSYGCADFTRIADAWVARIRQQINQLRRLERPARHLINNAGIGIGKRPEELALAEWNGLLATNLTGAFVAAQAAYPEMKRQGGGKIINIGSMFSIFGGPFAAAYGASKGGIVQLTKSLATAWAADNIHVNTVLPGCIDTDLSRGARECEPALHANVLRRTPAGRWGTPRDLAGAAVFLASAASVTGVAIPVDGGFAIQG